MGGRSSQTSPAKASVEDERSRWLDTLALSYFPVELAGYVFHPGDLVLVHLELLAIECGVFIRGLDRARRHRLDKIPLAVALDQPSEPYLGSVQQILFPV